MSSRKSTIIIAQAPGKQTVAFRKALQAAMADASLEILECHSMQELLELCAHRHPASVWIDRNLPDFSFESISRHLDSTKPLPGIKRPEWFVLQADSEEIERNRLTGSVEGVAALGAEAYRKKLLGSVEVLKAPDRAPVQISYSWSGKTALGAKEANDRIFGEERFRRLVNNSLDLICVIEEDGFIKYVSDSVERILGYSADFLSGQTIQEVFPSWNRKQLSDFLRKASARGAINNLEAKNARGAAVSLELVCSDMRTDPVIRGYVISARDVTKKRETEEKLRFQARLLSNIREAVIGIDTDHRIVYLNPAAEKLYKATLSSVKGKPLESLFSWEFSSQDEYGHFIDDLRENGVWRGEAIQVSGNGRRIHAEISITNHADQEQPGSIIVVRDIKDRKVVENVLHESETRFRNLVDVTSDLVWQIDGSANISFISPKVAELLGFTQSELVGKPFEMLFWHSDMEPADTSYESFLKVLNRREAFNYLNFVFTDKDGNEKIFELSGLPIYKAGNQFLGYQGVVRDITRRVEAENSIRASLAEKEILIKEIHHRVKNNMQIVSSLLFLQSQFIDDPKMLAKLQESQDRIKSMALVHEKLYQSTDLNRIDFRDYLESLTRHIANSYRNVNVEVRIEVEQQALLMPIDTAIPCGLILNELVSNAYKHAFGSALRGMLQVSFSIVEGKALLKVVDNGIGIESTDISKYENSSLGMQLVLALTKQLRGKLAVSNRNGSAFELAFPVQQ